MPTELNDPQDALHTRPISLGGDSTPGVSRARVAHRPFTKGMLR